MASETISFRVNTETYLKLEALASEKGKSVGLYMKDKVETEIDQLTAMQTDLAQLLAFVEDLRAENNQFNSHNTSSDKNTPAIIEILMILREIAQPSKLSSAQKKVTALGMEVFKSWGK